MAALIQIFGIIIVREGYLSRRVSMVLIKNGFTNIVQSLLITSAECLICRLNCTLFRRFHETTIDITRIFLRIVRSK